MCTVRDKILKMASCSINFKVISSSYNIYAFILKFIAYLIYKIITDIKRNLSLRD